MSETIEALLTRLVGERSGIPGAELAADAGLYSIGVDPDDLDDIWAEACGELGIDPLFLTADASPVPSGHILTSLRHLGPFWPSADAALRAIEAEARVPAEPTLRSLAASLQARRWGAAGPGSPIAPLPRLSAGRVMARAASVGVLTLFAGPAFGFLTCRPICHACHGSMSEAVTGALPTSLPMLAAIILAFGLPGVLYLRQETAAAGGGDRGPWLSGWT